MFETICRFSFSPPALYFCLSFFKVHWLKSVSTDLNFVESPFFIQYIDGNLFRRKVWALFKREKRVSWVAQKKNKDYKVGKLSNTCFLIFFGITVLDFFKNNLLYLLMAPKFLLWYPNWPNSLRLPYSYSVRTTGCEALPQSSTDRDL